MAFFKLKFILVTDSHAGSPSRCHPCWGRRQKNRTGICTPAKAARQAAVSRPLFPVPASKRPILYQYCHHTRIPASKKLAGTKPGSADIRIAREAATCCKSITYSARARPLSQNRSSQGIDRSGHSSAGIPFPSYGHTAGKAGIRSGR